MEHIGAKPTYAPVGSLMLEVRRWSTHALHRRFAPKNKAKATGFILPFRGYTLVGVGLTDCLCKTAQGEMIVLCSFAVSPRMGRVD